MAEHNQLGIKGEELAAEHLRQKGYAIRDVNWRSGKHELDIVAEKGDTLVFAEVKTRSGNLWGEPEEFVSRKKQQNLISAADAYVSINELTKEARFDIISIISAGSRYRINHIVDAFYPLIRKR